MIEIDGNYEEGGGAIVRQAMALSTVSGKAFTINNIRKGRCTPGLKEQHLQCVKAFEEISNSKAEGAELGSESIKFYPGKIREGTYFITIRTAGSITLLLQSLLLPTIQSKEEVTLNIIGGTDVKWSQPWDYFTNVLLPSLEPIADFEVKMERRGYFPKGQGKISIKIKGKENTRIEITEKGKLKSVKGISFASNQLKEKKVAERMKKGFLEIIPKAKIETEYGTAADPGCGVTAWASYENVSLGSDALGERKKRAEELGKEAALRLKKEMEKENSVDEYLEDQLIPFLAVYGGKIKVTELTKHTKSNLYVAEKFGYKLIHKNKEIRLEKKEKNSSNA